MFHDKAYGNFVLKRLKLHNEISVLFWWVKIIFFSPRKDK